MAQKPEYQVVVTADKAANNLSLFRCPRCFKWHTNIWNLDYLADKPEDNIKYANRQKFCDKCEETLWRLAETPEFSNHPAVLAVKEHCEILRRSLK